MLAVIIIVTHFHGQLVLLLSEGEALPTDGVMEPLPVVAVLPLLVAPAPMTREKNNILAGKIQTSLVPPNFSLLGHHPVLVPTLQNINEILSTLYVKKEISST